ncbi:MAG: DUF1565 domain-containing protein, partial [Planctomycetota bacterium]|nr:DUF1565 domain-containing protein [Planctomycetota bacterium]
MPARKDERLPLPTFKIPEPPAQPPLVVTSGGQRLLLGHTDAVVIWEAGDGGQKTLKSNRPGWWLINYPLDRIKGLERKTEDEIAGILFGRTRKKIKNWYFKTPGKAVAEPSKPRGPAPIAISDKPDLIVHAGHPKAADSNLGTQAAPLKSISEAVRRAQAGVTIHVYPGVYRESAKIEESGTKEQPLRLEGVRGAGGQMPVVSGNDIFPPDAWKPVRGLSGVFRADLFTGRLGTVSVNGKTLTERSVPHELKEGEYCLNRASKDFVNL